MDPIIQRRHIFAALTNIISGRDSVASFVKRGKCQKEEKIGDYRERDKYSVRHPAGQKP
jgi:hypothetical protein